ncbi:Gfo/Idh/MocA family oxidoreductase [Georgenia sp. TF02-10]|uniref:Gfo/Idh/MocA family protein n=1 Tax=Georgenia sp. TF02-10 TaxID=2917725 RepID=UPI001FA72325|nr:Gfo/Idh/MocA family oxidoreductase [Georgenia sp. TF02-10]UNX55323.1 Gfo/Idh/MocA family oxidoreductase [Georgenia sp. TF02-10]
MSQATVPPLGVAMIGYAFMGRAHSQGWRTAPRVFPLPREPRMQVLVGRSPERAAAAAAQLGWAEVETDWRRVLERDDVDVVDICTPGDTHAEIATAALAAGKHVLVEKPMANTLAEAEAMTAAAQGAAAHGVTATVGFTYRRVPALTLARDLVAEGRIGEVRQVRCQYLQDWLADDAAPLSWRTDRARAGSGALGDIGAHVVDLTHFVTGQRLAGVSGMLQTVVPERPVAESFAGLSGVAGTERGPVTVDDVALFTGRLEGGAPAIFEATRLAWGRKNAMRIEVSGSHGALAFDLEEMNVLHFLDAREPARTGGFRRILVTEPDHPYLSAWWPPGHGLGYEHAFVHQARDLVVALAAGEQPTPSFADGLAVQRVLDAVERSAADRCVYTEIPAHRTGAATPDRAETRDRRTGAGTPDGAETPDQRSGAKTPDRAEAAASAATQGA